MLFVITLTFHLSYLSFFNILYSHSGPVQVYNLVPSTDFVEMLSFHLSKLLMNSLNIMAHHKEHLGQLIHHCDGIWSFNLTCFSSLIRSRLQQSLNLVFKRFKLCHDLSVNIYLFHIYK